MYYFRARICLTHVAFLSNYSIPLETRLGVTMLFVRYLASSQWDFLIGFTVRRFSTPGLGVRFRALQVISHGTCKCSLTAASVLTRFLVPHAPCLSPRLTSRGRYEPVGGSVDAALRKRFSIHAVTSFENELRHDPGMNMSERLAIAQNVSQSKQLATHV